MRTCSRKRWRTPGCTPAGGDVALAGAKLEEMMDLCRRAKTSAARLAVRHDREFLEHLLRIPGPADEAPEPDALQAWGEALAARAREQGPESREYRCAVEQDPATGPCLMLKRIADGLAATDIYYQDFFAAKEYQSIRAYAAAQQELALDGARMERKAHARTASDFTELYEWLLAEARQGQTIQRYKGLGEMNPEQLWETTMRPDSRRLLKVDIGDASAADKLFDTLMGEGVEARRSFITENALKADNIDI